MDGPVGITLGGMVAEGMEMGFPDCGVAMLSAELPTLVLLSDCGVAMLSAELFAPILFWATALNTSKLVDKSTPALSVEVVESVAVADAPTALWFTRLWFSLLHLNITLVSGSI